jgi:hypothetical protein
VAPWEYRSSTDGSRSAILASRKLSKIIRWASIRIASPTLVHVCIFLPWCFVVQIPEFDNFYLDMNGIIHACSHPNDDDPTFRISEDKIFNDIFRYIEVSFTFCTCNLLLYKYFLGGLIAALAFDSTALLQCPIMHSVYAALSSLWRVRVKNVNQSCANDLQ